MVWRPKVDYWSVRALEVPITNLKHWFHCYRLRNSPNFIPYRQLFFLPGSATSSKWCFLTTSSILGCASPGIQTSTCWPESWVGIPVELGVLGLVLGFPRLVWLRKVLDIPAAGYSCCCKWQEHLWIKKTKKRNYRDHNSP